MAMRQMGRMTSDQRESFLLGRQHFESGDHSEALRVFEPLLKHHPRFADVHYMVGLAQERQGQLERASEALEKALAVNPGYSEAALALAGVYERRGLFDEARGLLERSATQPLRNDGSSRVDATTRAKLANLHRAIGDAYCEVGEWREAIEAYRKALDRAPGFHDIRYRLGVALREGGLPGQALAEFRRILRSAPSYLEAKVQLGLTYYTLGRMEQARVEWNGTLEQDPSRDDARMYLRMVGGGGRSLG